MGQLPYLPITFLHPWSADYYVVYVPVRQLLPPADDHVGLSADFFPEFRMDHRNFRVWFSG